MRPRYTLAVVLWAIPSIAGAHGNNNDPNVAHVCIGNVSKVVRSVGVSGTCVVGPPLVAETADHWSKQGGDISALLAAVTTLQNTVTTLEATVSSQAGQITTLQTTVSTQASQIIALDNKLQFVSVDGTEMFITGANLHIRNGNAFGNTWGGNQLEPRDIHPNGVGNLIVGYNEAIFGNEDRSGSHNIIVGPAHTYSSVGGLVAGYANRVIGGYAVVSGGQFNSAFNMTASISGGAFNSASGEASSVSGGEGNDAGASKTSISGGAGILLGIAGAWAAGTIIQVP
jgi:hypothetical protein